MLAFSLGAAALLALAIALILPALRGKRPINRDDRARQNIRVARRRLMELEAGDDAEIAAALLDDLPDNAPQKPPKTPHKAWTIVIVAALPIASVILYLALGTPAALMPGNAPATASAPATGEAPPIEELLAGLEAKLAENPGNAEGWALAGQTYMRLGRFADAERAYRALHQLSGDDALVLTAWADAALMAGDGAFSPAIRARLERALELQPGYDNALWLAALEAESRGANDAALAYLQRLLPLIEGRRGDAEVKAFIARMQGPAQSAATTENTPAPAGGGIRVRVRLDPKFAAQVGGGDSVYVFAKAVKGPPLPLAVSRRRAAELPLAVTLDDSMAMVAGMTISAFDEVLVSARLSRSGEPTAQPGDIESAAAAARAGAETLELVLDRVVE